MLRLLEFMKKGLLQKLLGFLLAVSSANVLFLVGFFWMLPPSILPLIDSSALVSLVFEITLTVAWTSLLSRITIFYGELLLVAAYRRRYFVGGSRITKKARFWAIWMRRVIRQRRPEAWLITFCLLFGIVYLSPVYMVVLCVLLYSFYSGIGKMVFVTQFRLSSHDAVLALIRGKAFLTTVSEHRIVSAKVTVWALVLGIACVLIGFMRFSVLESRPVSLISEDHTVEAAIVFVTSNGLLALVLDENRRILRYFPFSAIDQIVAPLRYSKG